MRSTPSPRSFSNVAFETVPMNMGDNSPHSSFQGRLSSTSSSMPLSSRQLMVRCPWLCAHRYCPQPLISLHSSMSSTAHLPVYLLSHFPSQQHVQHSTPAGLPAQSFPFTAACPGQHTCRSTCSVISLHSGMSRAAHLPVYLLSHFPSQRHVQGSTPAGLPAQSFPFTAACPALHTRRSFQRGMSTTDTFQPGLPVPLFVKRWLNLWGWQHVVWLTLLEKNQWRAWVTAFTVKLHNSKKHSIFIPMMPTSSSCASQFKSYRQLKLSAIKSPTVRNWPVEMWLHTAVSSSKKSSQPLFLFHLQQ